MFGNMGLGVKHKDQILSVYPDPVVLSIPVLGKKPEIDSTSPCEVKLGYIIVLLDDLILGL